MKKEVPLLMDQATFDSLNKIVNKIKNKKQFNDRVYDEYKVLNYKDLDKDDALNLLSTLDRATYLETLEKIERDNQEIEETLIKEEVHRLLDKYPDRFVLIQSSKGHMVLSMTCDLTLYYKNENGVFTIHERHEKKTLPILIIIEIGNYSETELVKSGKEAKWPVIRIKSWKSVLHKLERVTLPKD